MPLIEHIVLLKFKPGVAEATIAESLAQLGELKELIPGLLSYKWGPYASPEGLNKGFTHGFRMKLESAPARDDYLEHPEHERVKNAILPLLADIIVFDFEG